MAETKKSRLIRLYQLKDGYCYNSDSLFLFAFASQFLKKRASLLDVGCGCGILGALCMRDFDCELTMVEKSRESATLAQINVPRAKVHCEDFLEFQSEEKFDFILSNPPFYRSQILPSKNPRLNLARNESSLPLESMLKQMKRVLKPNGTIVFCYDAKETHRVFYELKCAGFNAEVARFVYPREHQDASLVMIKARIQSRASLQILHPLFTHIGKNQGDISSEVREIYALCNTYSIKIEEI